MFGGSQAAAKSAPSPSSGRGTLPLLHDSARQTVRCPAVIADTETRNAIRGFSANRRTASTSFTWAASRNFNPPNFTKGMLRASAQFREARCGGKHEKAQLAFSAQRRLALLQVPFADIVGLIDFVRTVTIGRSAEVRSVQRFFVKRSEASPITALAAPE